MAGVVYSGEVKPEHVEDWHLPVDEASLLLIRNKIAQAVAEALDDVLGDDQVLQPILAQALHNAVGPSLEGMFRAEFLFDGTLQVELPFSESHTASEQPAWQIDLADLIAEEAGVWGDAPGRSRYLNAVRGGLTRALETVDRLIAETSPEGGRLNGKGVS